MSELIVRPATEGDLAGLLGIYNWAVANTTATMDTEPRSLAGQREWLEAHNGVPYPALVAEASDANGLIVGYASLSSYNRKDGYRTSAEVSVYVHPEWHRRGIGATLMHHLIEDAAARKFVSLISLITVDNVASIRLHHQFGFTEIGTLRKVARKFDRWVDVLFMQRILTTED